MNKMEVLALLFKCNAKINEYLENDSFDPEKVSSAKIKAIVNGINKDYSIIQTMSDESNFIRFGEKLQSLYVDILTYGKEVNQTEILNAICNINDCQKKLDKLNLDNLDSKVAKTLKLITACQKELKELSSYEDLDTNTKNTFEVLAMQVNEDFNNVVRGSKVEETYEEYKEILDYLKNFKNRKTQPVKKQESVNEPKATSSTLKNNNMEVKIINLDKKHEEKENCHDEKKEIVKDKQEETTNEENYDLKEQTLSSMMELNRRIESLMNFDYRLISDEDKDYLQGLSNEITKDYIKVAGLSENDPLLEEYFNKYQDKWNEFINKEEEIESRHISAALLFDNQDNEETKNRHAVSRIVNKDDVPENTKNSNKVLKRSLMAAAAAGLVALGIWLGLHLNGKEADKESEASNTPEPTATVSVEPTPTPTLIPEALIAQNINMDNYDELYSFACDMQSRLPEGSDLTIDDIMYALRLANFDKLENKSHFSDRDEVCAATYITGKLAPVVGVDALVQRDENDDIYITDTQMQDIIMTSTDNFLSLDNFKDAKTEKGYDIYKVLEICLDQMYKVPRIPDAQETIPPVIDPEHPIPNPTETTKPEDDPEYVPFNYAKVMNEVVCREAVNFSICGGSPVSTHYVIAGMFTANQEQILYLTSKKNLGPIYGTGPRIDGSHGAMCVEELASLMYIDTSSGTFIGNERNAIYSYVIDENITCEYNIENQYR